jgi:hypothetical protein
MKQAWMRRVASAALVMGAVASAPAMAQDVDLVLCIDGSSSMGSGGFGIETEGTAQAVENVIPHNGSVRLTVIQFSSDAQLEVGPVVIDDTNFADVANDIRNISYLTGQTDIRDCVELAQATVESLMPETDRWVLDVSSDGGPQDPQAAYDAADVAYNAGFDAINGIGIGDDFDGSDPNNPGYEFMEHFVRPQPVGGEDGFWVWAQTVDDYPEILAQKIEREIGCVGGDATVLCTTDGSGDFRVSLTFENNSESSVEHLFLIPQGMGITVDPPYFNLTGDPICTSQDPGCTNPTRTFEVIVSGADEGELVDILMQPYGPDFADCCSNLVTIEMPYCECAQLVDSSIGCRWERPNTDPIWFWTFEIENLADFEVDDLLLFPISPLNLEITPPYFTGLGLDPVPWTGTDGSTTLTVSLDAPQLWWGDEVCIQLNLHDDTHGSCCDIVECVTLPQCRWVPWPTYDEVVKEVSPYDDGGDGGDSGQVDDGPVRDGTTRDDDTTRDDGTNGFDSRR